VEREDFAAGTSSRSTKLVHGGVRYLEKAFKGLDYGQLKLVFEALHERRTVLDIAPHLATALPIMTVRRRPPPAAHRTNLPPRGNPALNPAAAISGVRLKRPATPLHQLP
jgi:glycerol-3-phosphate dehydrogenase